MRGKKRKREREERGWEEGRDIIWELIHCKNKQKLFTKYNQKRIKNHMKRSTENNQTTMNNINHLKINYWYNISYIS
jgi:hypothetical protein